jgi:hypothetical protein
VSLTDTVARIAQLQSQLASLNTAFSPPAPASSAQGANASAPTSTSSTFADTLAQAQAGGAVAAAAGADSGSLTFPTLPSTPVYPGAGSGSPYAAAGGASPYAPAGGASPYPGAPLSASAQAMLTGGQQQFVARLAADTGLSAQVVASWALAEESGGAAQSRQVASNNDWLNIGYTDSGTYGASDSVWSDPIVAADATAGWLKGQNTIPGYGTASPGIQAILTTVGQSPQVQIAAIQGSGWASSGYPDLPTLYQQVAA